MEQIAKLNRIFYDESLQLKFSEDGFVKVDLLSAEEVDELVEYYKQNDLLPDEGGFYATMFNPDSKKKQEISDRLTSLVSSRVNRLIKDYRPLFGNYIVKGPRNRHEVGIHQDWTYVDERKYRSFNVWTSLCHSNDQNGGMFMLPGSHNVRMPIRWTPFDSRIYDRYSKEIKTWSIGLDLLPGQAAIYDSAVIHYSTYNDTPDMRMACGCVFVPEETGALHYYREGDRLLVYEADTMFFHNMKPGEKPEGGHSVQSEFFEAFDEVAFDKAAFEDLFK